jgi:protein-S-isoprenylcysteine O-methyltransferase Ste14
MDAMNEHEQLRNKAIVGAARAPLLLAALIFAPAWSVAYWQGWLYWAVSCAGVWALTFYLLHHDPDLMKRRLKAGPLAERRPRQRLIQSVTSVFLAAIYIVPGIDHHQGWSQVPWPGVAFGELLVVLGFIIVFWTFRENSFASSIVEVTPGQRVVSTGPYARVRHPMYSGALLIFFGTPLALGSWWGLIPAAGLAGALVWRLLDEERVLIDELAGYRSYRETVRARLVPGLY